MIEDCCQYKQKHHLIQLRRMPWDAVTEIDSPRANSWANRRCDRRYHRRSSRCALSAMPIAIGMANKSPVRVEIPRRRFSHSTAIVPPSKPPTMVLPPGQDGRETMPEQRGIFHPAKDFTAYRGAKYGGDDDGDPFRRSENIAFAATNMPVKREAHRIGKRFKYKVYGNGNDALSIRHGDQSAQLQAVK